MPATQVRITFIATQVRIIYDRIYSLLKTQVRIIFIVVIITIVIIVTIVNIPSIVTIVKP